MEEETHNVKLTNSRTRRTNEREREIRRARVLGEKLKLGTSDNALKNETKVR